MKPRMNAKRVRKCAGVDKRERWLERENEVGENQKACTSVYMRRKMTEQEWRRERRRTHVITKLFHL